MELKTGFRVTSIDILRGLVMVIMALDHTRDFFHVTALTDNPLNLATTTVPLFFSRWITHFCAPVFVFLSGTSAWLSSKNKTPAEASKFLLKRGIWLVLVEVIIITLAITFNPFYNFIIFQVIWAIGWSMIILGLLIRFPYFTIPVLGFLIFFGHNLFDHIEFPKSGLAGTLTTILFTASGTVLPLNKTHFIGDFYAILPWTGVMLLGYSIGPWFRKEFPVAKRKRLLLISGVIMILLFIILRFPNWYGEPVGWDHQHFLSFINTTKYPPSLFYLFMTLGPALVALAFLEVVNNRFTSALIVYGRVPFFYYVLHFYLLHCILVIIFFCHRSQ
jgi:uncharacterized membrane protein